MMRRNQLIEQDEYRGSQFIKIFEIDDKGEKKSEKPVISFGLKKAKVIVESLEEIKQFIKDNE